MVVGKSNEPSIELYMNSLRQEYPSGQDCDVAIWKVHGKEGSPNTIRIPKNARANITDVPELPTPMPRHVEWCANNSGHNQIREGGAAIRMALTREEDFGGLIYDPVHDKVYKVNIAGLHLFRDLQYQVRSGTYTPSSAQEEFILFLREVGLLE